jgi:RHS repeat-associated protein
LVNYTKFDRTKDITEGDYKLTLEYGPFKDRKKTVLEYQNSVTQTRYYSGSYEKTVTATGTQEVHYISCGNGVNIAYVIEGSTGSYHYLHSDYLGSILAVSDASGNLEYEQNFDAWGRDRNPADWTYTASATTRPSWLYRGFTGHEHLREFTLINMNARMYDSETGRMLAVDNYVLDPHNSQDYNRYSYARNNPLKYTDPDGEIAVVAAVAIGAIVGAYLGGSTANGTFNPVKWDYSSSATWIGMGTGALIGGLSGGVASTGQFAIAGGVTVAGVTVGQVTLSSNRGVNELNVSSGERSYSLASWGSEENSNIAQANSFNGADSREPEISINEPRSTGPLRKSATAYITNNSPYIIYFKPEGDQNGGIINLYHDGAYPLWPGQSWYQPIDGVKTSLYTDKVFKVKGGRFGLNGDVTIARNGQVDQDFYGLGGVVGGWRGLPDSNWQALMDSQPHIPNR